MQSNGGFTGTTLFVAYNNDMRGTRLALICLHQHRLTPVLATAANALDHAVERHVLAIDRIVRIHQVFLRGHLIGARLAAADRCAIQRQLVVRVRRLRCGWIWRTSRLRNRHRCVDQGQQGYRRDPLSHDGLVSWAPSRSWEREARSQGAARLTFCSDALASLSLAFSGYPAGNVEPSQCLGALRGPTAK